MNQFNWDWDWLDDLGYLLKILTPIIVLLVGIFSSHLDPELREKLILSGALATGTQTRQK